MTTSIAGGYEPLSVIQLCNVLTAVEQKNVSYGAFRTFFAAVSLLSTRNAAQRATGKKMLVCFELSELQTLTGKSKRYVQRALSNLKRAKLVDVSSSAITLNTEPIEGSQELLSKAAGKGRHVNRVVPLPRRILRYLARCSLPSLAKALIAYLIRGLSKRRDGSLNNRGSVKSSWIAGIAGISLSAAKAARQLLIMMGVLTKDIGSSQHKLNRTGAYFEINTEWQSADEAERARQRQERLKSGPPIAQNGPKSDPPNKRHKTLSDTKNQRTHPSGASKKQELGEPTLHDIQLDDLKKMSRLFKLYEQAVEQGWLEASEANLLFFIASAIRVKRTPCQDLIRAFIAIVRKDLRSHITQAQEDAARKHLAAYRQRPGAETGTPSSHQNDDSFQGLRSVKEILSNVLEGVSESLGIQTQVS
ncbi:hypothetical protein Lepto7375DRAFT_0059 [Leptolyngbya sp. PCC 7375]|nr:hypothetical protein Lepto7375DRAFT_0059 [Leptolyngbya sp. PCC 7375]